MSILYMCTIYPLELIYKHIYLACVSVVGSYGVGLMVMSLVTFVIFVPLKKWAKKAAGKERDIQDVLASQIAKIQSESTGAERQERISKLYKRYGYHPVMAIRSAIGAGLQIPFLMAAYYMISGLKGLEGQSFLFVKNLSRPDGLLFGLNLLPIVMTLINFATTFTTKDMRTKDRVQAVVIALLFLALLYSAPSALLIYWTCNNILYLAENIRPVKAFTDKMVTLISFLFARGIKRPFARLKKTSLTPEQQRIVFALCFGLLCGVFIFIFIPLNTYWHNVNEFIFKPKHLVRALTPYALICPAIFAGLAFLTLKIKKTAENNVSAFYVFILSVMFALLVEGTLMSYGLKQLNGQENLFASKGRMIFDSAVWLGIIGGFIYFRRNIARNFVKVIAVFILFCSATLVDTFIHREEKVTESSYRTVSEITKELTMASTQYDILSLLQYSNNDNVLIIMPDATDTMSLEKTLELNPSLKEILKGFHLFKENLGVGGQTKLAVPQILSGKTYTGKKYRQFVQNALFGEASLPIRSVKNGRKTFIEADFWSLSGGGTASDSEPKTKKKKKIMRTIFSYKDKVSFAFRFIPYAVKGKFENIVNYTASADFPDNPNKPVFDAMTKRIRFKTDTPVTQFIHMHGTHPPYKDRVKTVEQWLMQFADYIKALKADRLYDKSTIIVIADHGDHIDHRNFYPERKAPFGTFHFPIFLIKTPDSDKDMTVRNEPMSTLYLTDLLNTFYAKGQTLAVLNEYVKNLPSIRPIFIDSTPGYDSETKYLAYGDFQTLSLKKDDGIFQTSSESKKAEKNASELEPLKENVVYTFSVEKENFPYPDWIGEGFGKYGGGAADFRHSRQKLSLRGDVKPKAKKHFSFQIDIYEGKNATLKLTDENTKKSVTVSADDRPTLYLNIEATADKNGMFNFSFERIVPFQGALCFVSYGNEENDLFEIGREYKMSKSYRSFSSLYSGWWTPENSGTWTVKKEAKARFKLLSSPRKDIKVFLTFSLFTYPNANKFLKITLPDGRVVYEKKFADEVSGETVQFLYPLELRKKDNTVHLTIESNVKQHNILNSHISDTRTLGTFLRSVKLEDI